MGELSLISYYSKIMELKNMKKILVLAAFAAQVFSFNCVKADLKETIKNASYVGFDYVKDILGFNNPKDLRNLVDAISQVDPTKFKEILDTKTDLSEDYKKDILAQLDAVKSEWEKNRGVIGRVSNLASISVRLTIFSILLFSEVLIILATGDATADKATSDDQKVGIKQFAILIAACAAFPLYLSVPSIKSFKKLFIPARKIGQLEQMRKMVEEKTEKTVEIQAA